MTGPCFYVCERTGEAIWVPWGKYFVVNRTRGAQPTGTVMGYLFSQRTRVVGPESYGFHHTGRTTSGKGENIRRPIGNHASMVGRPERGRSTRVHGFNPLVRSEIAAAVTGSTRTIVVMSTATTTSSEATPPLIIPTITIYSTNRQTAGHAIPVRRRGPRVKTDTWLYKALQQVCYRVFF